MTRASVTTARKSLASAVAVVAVLALAAGSAQAKPQGGGTRIVAAIEEIGFGPSTAACELGVVSFSLVAPGGAVEGSGVSCIHAIVGCEPFVLGCHDTAYVDFTFTFAGGSVTAPMVLKEVQTGMAFVQRGKGKISSGTGVFAEAKGSIKGGGVVQFSAAGIVSGLVYTVHVNCGDDCD